MASVLSQFLAQPVAGAAFTPPNTYTWSNLRPVYTIAATDTTAGAGAFPQLVLKTAYATAPTGGSLVFQSQNSTPAYLSIATIQGQITVQTPGAESGSLTLNAYISGTSHSVQLNGQNAAVVPDTTGVWGLGLTGQRFSNLYLGNAAVTITGEITMDATSGGVLFGSNSNVQMAFKSNNVLRATFAAAGQFGHNVAPVAANMNTIGGTHLSNAVAIGGMAIVVTIPSTATTSYIGFQSSPTTPATVFTLGIVEHFQAGDVSKGAGSVITSQYGFVINDLTAGANNYGYYSAMTAGANKWAIYAGGAAKSYFAGNVGIGDNTVTGIALSIIDTSNAFATAVSITSNTGNTSTLLKINGFDNLSAYVALSITDNSANTKLLVRGDGAVFFNTATANWYDSAFMTTTGRWHLTGDTLNATITDPNFSTWGSGPYSWGFSDVRSIASSAASASGMFVLGTINLSGTGSAYVGASYNINLASSTIGTQSVIGAQYYVQSNGNSRAYAFVANCYSLTGNGIVGGAQLNVGGTGTNSVYGLTIQCNNTQPLLQGVSIGSTSTVTVGYNVSAVLTGAAFQWIQSAGSTGYFAQLVNSSAQTIFYIDVGGNMSFAGATTPRIFGDMSNATLGSRLLFESSTAGGNTSVGAIPNGTPGSPLTTFTAYSANDPTNAALMSMACSTAGNQINSAKTGSGTVQTLGLAISGVNAMTVQVNSDITLGPTGAVTTMSAGFPYIPAAAGPPTGVPTARSGFVPAYYDTTDHKLWLYDTAWKGVVVS